MSVDLKRISANEPVAGTPVNKPAAKDNKVGPSFEQMLRGMGGMPTATPAAPANAEIKFSNHAIDRMVSRGIQFSPQDRERLSEAVARAAAKGSKDSLILMDEAALIVSVKNKTVVTVMDKSALKENVFTNIDSTIVL